MEESLASGGITGAITMAMLLAMRVYESRKAKANGGSTYDNIKQNQGTLRILEERNQRVEQDVAELARETKNHAQGFVRIQRRVPRVLSISEGD